MKRLILIIILFFTIGKTEEKISRVKVFYHNPDEISGLLKLVAATFVRDYPNNYVEVIVESGGIEEIKKSGLKYEVIVADLAEYYRKLLGDGKGGVFGNYYLYREIYQSILALQSRFPALVKVDSLPTRSIEGRALYTVKVSSSPGSNNGRPEVLISGAIHAYEPIGPSLCMSDMIYLCERYASDPEIRWLIDNRQVYFIPVMNPDGYVYNETYPSRMWRKNRRNNGGSFGVDLNRNYPYKWGYDNVGSSPTPSAWNYRGTAPASEPETKAVVDFVNGHRIRTWHNHHSPNDVLLIPFGYIDSYPWTDTIVYWTMCREESLLYGFNRWGNSYRAYGYLVNGGVEDWAWCDSATYRVYCLVPELGMDYWEGLNDSSKIVNVCMRMLGAELYLIQVAGFFPRILSIAVNDSPPGGNNDGVLNPGERARLRITLRNKAVVDTAFGLIGYLSTNYQRVSITDSVGGYGNVIRLTSAVNSSDPFVLACSTTAQPNDWVRFNLRLVWNSGNYQKTLPCSLRIGPVSAVEEEGLFPISDFDFMISPNPTRCSNIRFQITSARFQTNTKSRTKLEIYDVLGKLIADLSIFVPERTFNLALNPGVYFVRIKSGDFSSVRKLVVLP